MSFKSCEYLVPSSEPVVTVKAINCTADQLNSNFDVVEVSKSGVMCGNFYVTKSVDVQTTFRVSTVHNGVTTYHVTNYFTTPESLCYTIKVEAGSQLVVGGRSPELITIVGTHSYYFVAV
jgi:hypothetical protein